MQTRFTDRALAYLKASLPSDGSPSVVLSKEDSPIVRPLTDGLCVCHVVDEGGEYRYVQRRHLMQEDVSEERLHAIGVQNLLSLAASRDLRVQSYGSIFAVLMGGDFEASLILLDQLWDSSFRQFVQGDYAIAIPNRDILAFCDSTSPAGLEELHQLIARVHTSGDHPISSEIYVRIGNEWQKK